MNEMRPPQTKACRHDISAITAAYNKVALVLQDRWRARRLLGPIPMKNRTKMFHVKHFCPVEAKNLTRPQTALPLYLVKPA